MRRTSVEKASSRKWLSLQKLRGEKFIQVAQFEEAGAFPFSREKTSDSDSSNLSLNNQFTV